MSCEICGNEPGFPGDIHDIPVLICVPCMRRSQKTTTGNLKEQVSCWMWKRRVLRQLGASTEIKLGARTKWLMAKRKLEEEQEQKKLSWGARFSQSAAIDLERIISQVQKGQRSK